ncbi:major facilitator superfamily domain-containing protein [Dendryphion nanum]|uniref:Major facilitator superfamily domain-containing protein n=1 Tax=Dendryphion nanum TaxID=256645 RepID=A0A9P9DIU8_9PLEO|nr:major facilitator superfamily domain-containing protein [Dendryphion nanum]
MADVKSEGDHIESRHSQIPGQDIGNDTDVVLLDAGAAHLEKGQYTNLKLAEDGHTVLIPQPSADPNDPLNWSWRKKHLMLMVISTTAFLGDYGSGAGIPLIVGQGQEWGLSPAKVNESGNLNVLMLGIGGLIWIVIASWWGRAPVMFWSTLTGTFFTLACAVTDSFPVYYGFRAMMGLTLTAYQVVGLAVVKDMFYFHEHARKIGIWVAIFILSPYLGPFFANFIIAGVGDWRPVMWLVFAMCVADMVLIVLICDETYYDRTIPIDQQPPRPQTLAGRLSRVIGVWQIQHHTGYFKTAGQSCKRLASTFIKPIIIPAMLYYAMSFMWAVGINITSTILLETPIPAGGYGFGPKSVGYLYFTPLVAVVLGEAFGHFFNDWVANRYVRKHQGIFKPEARLVTNYVAAGFMIPGLIIVGQTLEKHLSYAGIIMGWGMYVFGVMLATVAITAYALDSYGSASSEVSGLLNFARGELPVFFSDLYAERNTVIAGFSVGYFQMPWGLKSGFGLSFGIQAIIVAAAMGIIALLQVYGGKLRTKGGPVV